MRLDSLPIRETVHYRLEPDQNGYWIYCAICQNRIGEMPREIEWDKLLRKELCGERFKRHLEFSPTCVRFKIIPKP